MDGLDVLMGQQPSQNGLDVLLANQPINPPIVSPQMQNSKPITSSENGLFSGSVLSQIADASRALGHHAMGLPHGIAQGVENLVNYGAQQLPDNPVSRYINKTVQSDNAAMSQREKEYQQSTPDSIGAYTGATVGEIAPFLLNGVAAPIRAAGDYAGKVTAQQLPEVMAKTGGKIASGATQGAIIGAAQPVTNPDYWQGKEGQVKSGAIFGGAVPLATGAIQGIYNAAQDVLQPLTNPSVTAAKRLATATGIDPQRLASALQNPMEYVKGSAPTTAQVIATPEAIQLEKSLRNNPEFTSKLENIANANNAARLEAINSVAGAPGALEQATADRASKAQELYQQAFNEYDPANVTPWVKGQITQLMKRPAMQSAIKEAQGLAQNEGLALNDANSIQGLHYAKMSLDDQISRAMRTGDNNAARALIDTKNQLLTVMGKLSPTYNEAMTTYAGMSKPINTMEVGQQLQDKLWSGNMNTAGDPAIQFQQYKATLAKALGGAEYGINPEAQTTLQNIQNDLQRQTISGGLRFPGSDTAYNQQAQGWLSRQLYGPEFSGSGGLTKAVGAGLGGVAGSVVGHPYAGAAAGGGAALGLSKLASNRVNNALADIMTSPETASKALSSLTPTQRGLMVKMLEMNPLTQQLIQSAANAP